MTREEISERRILKREGEKAKQKAQIGAGVWDLVPDVYPVNRRRFCHGAEDVSFALPLPQPLQSLQGMNEPSLHISVVGLTARMCNGPFSQERLVPAALWASLVCICLSFRKAHDDFLLSVLLPLRVSCSRCSRAGEQGRGSVMERVSLQGI